jgi:uncharacterized protein
MYYPISAPKQRLSKDAIKLWIISETIMNVIGYILLGGLFFLDHLYKWKEWIGWILIFITILCLLFTMFSYIKPFLLYKNWRFDVDEEFLQMKSGAINEVHQLVPMTKIQSVATKQGPLLRKYGLRSLSIITMGSTHIIPALPNDVAIELRNQIAHFAKLKEVE